ncbi:MAG TPA: CDP-alcohol phosphatidyltransferase family protein [Chloroflexota bacterium]|nr:CDP-alcohol phosphatidyltransferase family protein [Chloroflexota bacterium]
MRGRWGMVTAVYLLTILFFYLLWQWVWPCCAERWLGITAVTAVYCLWVVWRHLPENHRPGETDLLPRFGWGNRLTLLRGLMISLVAGFLLSPWPGGWLGWLPAILYTIADIADYLDGYAARITNHATRLGERLDMEFDGLGLVVVTLLAVWYGQLPTWYLLIGFARYFFVFGLWLRQKRQLPAFPLPHSWHRRIFAGFQMAFMSVVLWPIVPAVGAAIAGTLFALATSASFMRDWLVTIGWLDPATAVYQQWQRRVYVVTAVYLPPILRLLLLLSLWQLYINFGVGQWVTLFTTWRLPGPAALAQFWAVVGVVTAVLVILGILGRLMTLPLLFPLGFTLLVVEGAEAQELFAVTTAVTCTILILLLGTGTLSLWKPEEKWMVRRAGE